MRRKRMHGKRRRRSSCKPSPLKHIISMYKEDQHPHNKDGSHPTETKKENWVQVGNPSKKCGEK